jgi:ribosomal protein L36
MTYPSTTVLHADATIESAKQYIADHKLTAEDVKIVKRDDGVYVIAKREVTLNG